jgi:hypothetical protein
MAYHGQIRTTAEPPIRIEEHSSRPRNHPTPVYIGRSPLLSLLTAHIHPPKLQLMAEYAHLSTPDPEFSVLWSKLQAAYPPPGTITVASQRHAMTSIVNPKVMDNLRPHLPPGTHLLRALHYY